VFAFGYAILFGGVWTSKPMQDAMSSSEMFKGHGSILTSIIGLELLYGTGKQIFNKDFKLGKA
jgi:hypothetical protein